MKKIALASIRAQNLKQIFDVIVKEGPTTRGRLAQATNLSLMTVSNVVENMINNDIIAVRSKKSAIGAGRKAELVDVVQDAHALLVLDLTEREFSHVVLGLNGKTLFETQPIPTDIAVDYKKSLQRYLEKVAEEIRERGYEKKLVGVGVAAPGPYQVDTDTVYTQLIPELNEIRLKALINETLGDEVMVYIDEDVKYAARANLSMVENAMEKTLAYVYIGEGVGGAFLVNGRILMGAHSMAGEVSRMLIGDGGRRAGTLSRPHFLQKLGIEHQSDWLTEVLKIKASDESKISAALDEIAVDLAELCYGLCWLVDPHQIILECDYVRMLDENFTDKVQQLLAERLQGVSPHAPKVSMTYQGLRYAYRGAAMVLTEKWLENLASSRASLLEE